MTHQTTETRKHRSAAASLISSLGLLAIAIAVVIPILNGGFPESPLYKWLYSAGTALCVAGVILSPAPPANTSARERRWARIEGWSTVMFAAATFFMWYPDGTPRDWLAFTLAGATIRIIVFFRSLRRNSAK